ncbi:hypothetical protein pb186bvf_013626 [Paramecium bursaria]
MSKSIKNSHISQGFKNQGTNYEILNKNFIDLQKFHQRNS